MAFEVRNAVLSFSIVRVGWDRDRVSAGMAVCEAVCVAINQTPRGASPATEVHSRQLKVEKYGA
jgi:hypothetical protein